MITGLAIRWSCIDEVEKAAHGYGRSPDFQDELLAVLDESNAAWFDNFLEIGGSI